MFEQIVLGVIQGIGEWIPISSEGCLVLAKTRLFHSTEPLNVLINQALLLHLGTLLAAIIYFRKDLLEMFVACGNWTKASGETKKLFVFLTLTTAISGVLGLFAVKKLSSIVYHYPKALVAITIFIAAALIVTGFLQLTAPKTGKRSPADLTPKDGILLGIVQGLATLPGLSRSGTTIAVLLFRNFDKQHALKLSFLMSMPLIFIGNIVMNYKTLASVNTSWIGILVAFVVGLLSIKFFMTLAQKINFGAFLIFIGAVMIVSTLL